ncbi:protein PRD1 [Tanacetum coccineum]
MILITQNDVTHLWKVVVNGGNGGNGGDVIERIIERASVCMFSISVMFSAIIVQHVMFSASLDTLGHLFLEPLPKIEPYVSATRTEVPSSPAHGAGVNESNGKQSRYALLSNKERLLLRKQALKMRKRHVLAVGKGNNVSGVAKTNKTHFNRVIHGIIEEIEESIRKSTFVKDFDLIGILSLHTKCTELVEHLVTGNENNYPKVVKVLQDVLEIVTNDMMRNGSSVLSPHLKEEVKFSKRELKADQDYVSIGFYMQKIFPVDWENYVQKDNWYQLITEEMVMSLADPGLASKSIMTHNRPAVHIAVSMLELQQVPSWMSAVFDDSCISGIIQNLSPAIPGGWTGVDGKEVDIFIHIVYSSFWLHQFVLEKGTSDDQKEKK